MAAREVNFTSIRIQAQGPPGELPWAPGEYLTCDLFGPLLRSAGGARYVGFYLDLKSRFIYAKLLVNKTSHYQALREVIRDLRARSGNRLRYFKTDGDKIFTGEEANRIYADFQDQPSAFWGPTEYVG